MVPGVAGLRPVAIRGCSRAHSRPILASAGCKAGDQRPRNDGNDGDDGDDGNDRNASSSGVNLQVGDHMTKPISRRGFIRTAAVGAGIAAFSSTASAGENQGEKRTFSPGKFATPVAVSTWSHGQRSGQVALGVLGEGGAPVDAVEQGINVVERDPEVTSVGVGGLTNHDGVVELDAAIMTGELRCGSVSGLRQIATPISVARKVMEKTRHIQLVGEGALRFALEQGFKKEELLTPGARARWEKWLASANRPVPPQIDPDGKEKTHDTVTTLGDKRQYSEVVSAVQHEIVVNQVENFLQSCHVARRFLDTENVAVCRQPGNRCRQHVGARSSGHVVEQHRLTDSIRDYCKMLKQWGIIF